MKKIVELNTCDYGSTGKIMLQIAAACRNGGNECKIVVPAGRHNPRTNKIDYIYIGNRLAEDSHIAIGYITGFQDCFSIYSTFKLIKALEKYKPDIIHIHNLHKCYINLPILWRYIKKERIDVVWTLHDCWPFTGHCTYFSITKCDKWKNGCYNCPSFRNYPQSFVDNSRLMWRLKKKWFTGVKTLTIVTPSQWLANLVKQSFLKDYPVRVINNGVDLSIFKPTDSDFRKRYEIPTQKMIILGVAFDWGIRKGLDVFVELAKRLPYEMYQIVLVGTDDNIDKQLPNNIISIHRTKNQQELAEIYTAADLFINPTREEVLGMVNVEALACGTPGITFRSGGSPECYDKTCGEVVDCDDVDAMEREIIHICTQKPFTKEACLKRAQAFDMNERYKEYVELYNEIATK